MEELICDFWVVTDFKTLSCTLLIFFFFAINSNYHSRLHVLVSVHSSCGVSILSFSQYPGWTLTPDGSLFMATVNDDAVGTYVCTPYNSYGSMGPSGPTKVILQVSAHSRAPLSVGKLCITSPHFQCLKSACTQNYVFLIVTSLDKASSLHKHEMKQWGNRWHFKNF